MQNRRSELLTGLKKAGLWLLLVGWLCGVVVGIGLLMPSSAHRPFGGVLIASMAAVAIFTVDLWVRILPAFCGLAALNAVLALWNGYAGGDPQLAVPRTQSLVTFLRLLTSGALAMPLRSRSLTLIDRIALLGFLVSLSIAIARFPSLLGFVLMPLCLGLAWGLDRNGQRGRDERGTKGTA
jgi:hypothetical protein